MGDVENTELVLIEENVVILTAIAVTAFENRRIITENDINSFKRLIKRKQKENGINNIKYIKYNCSCETSDFIHFESRDYDGYYIKPNISKSDMIDKYEKLILEGIEAYDFLNYEKFGKMYRVSGDEEKKLEGFSKALEKYAGGNGYQKVKGKNH